MPRGNFLVNLDDDNKVSIFYFWKHLEEDATLTAGLLLQMVQILLRRPVHALLRKQAHRLVLCTLTPLALNLCHKTNPMWPCFNIWSFSRTPCWDPSVVAHSARRHPPTKTCPAFILEQSPYMLLCWLAGSQFFFVALVPSAGHT